MSGEALGISGRMLEGQSLTAATVGSVTGLQWQVLSNGQWVNVGTAGSATYTLPSGSSGKSYRITGSAAGATLVSDATPAVKKDTGSARTPAISGGLLTSNATEQAAPLAVLAPLTVTDADNTNFNGGSLTVLNSNALSRGGDGLDTLSVLTGSGQGQFSYNATTRALSYGLSSNGSHTVVGTVDAARTGAGTDFSVTFNSSATKAVVDALVNKIAFQSNDDSPLASRLLTLQVTDSTARVAQQSHIVNVVAVNDLPVFAGAAALSAAENQTAVATLAATDVDSPTEPLTFALVAGAGDTHNQLFTIASGTGVLQYKAAPDFEATTGAHAIRVRVTDSAGGATERNYTVAVQNVNEAPVVTQPLQLTLTEDTASMQVPLSWADPEGTTPTISVETQPALGLVTVNGTQVSYTPGSAFQSLSAGQQVTQAFSIRLVDDQGAATVHAASVQVTGLNDAPVITGLTGEQAALEEPVTGRAVLDMREGSLAVSRGSDLVMIGRYIGETGGWESHIQVVRPDGQVEDLTPGQPTVLPTSFFEGAVAMDSSGRIIVAGQTSRVEGGDVVTLRRYLGNGALDTTFGSGGVVELPTLSIGSRWRVDVRPDNSLVVGTYDPGHYPQAAPLTAVHVSAAGQVDPAFGTGGLLSLPLQQALAVDGSGRIVTASFATTLVQDDTLLLNRFLPDGSLDASFGSGGTVTYATGAGIVSLQALQLTADGGVLAVWDQAPASPGGDWVPHVVRFEAGGTLDTSYGSGGVAQPLFSGQAVSLDAAGRLLLATAQGSEFTVTRLTPNGQLDTTFGDQGVSHAGAFAGSPVGASTNGLALAGDGSIWVHGIAAYWMLDYRNAVARLAPGGSPDTTLVDGEATLSASGSFAVAASDVDANATLSWFGSDQGLYGQLAVTAAGDWVYTLDPQRPATQALASGQQVQDAFTVGVRDEFGLTATAQVSFSVTGS